MKAGVLFAKKDIRCEEIDEPKITDDGVKIRVEVCGICGSDIPRVNKGKAHYFPIVLGHEFSGVITEVGKNVTKYQVGDYVAVAPLIPCFECEDCKNGNYSLCKNYSFIGSRIQGGFGEYVVVPEQNVVKFDKKLSFEEGAMLEPATVALHAIKCANYENKNNVLVVGCGTIGAFTLQWLKALGAKNIVCLVRSEQASKLALELGADYVVNSKSNEDYKNQLQQITNNRGFDYVFDAVGSQESVISSLENVGNKGSIMLIGTPTSDVTFSIKQWELINRKECFIGGSWMSYSSIFPGEEWVKTVKAFEDGSLKLNKNMINKVFDLEEIGKAFEQFENEKTFGRTLIKVKR